MRKFFVAITAILLACTGSLQAQTGNKGQEMTRKEKKAAQEALDQALYEEAKAAIENKTFVLEADRVIFKRGMTAYVAPSTNFVGMNKDKAVVQVAFNIPASGPNGIGGITVQGSVSSFETRTDKRGNIYVSMYVTGVGISAQVNINLTKGCNDASVTILPNFNSNRMTLSGHLLPMEKANVFEASSL